MAEYVFDPEVGEEVWLNVDGGNLWPVWRSMPHPKEWEEPERKKLLLVAHMLRQVADQLTDPRCLAVIEVGEQFADGLISFDAMWAAHEDAAIVWDNVRQPNEAMYAAVAAARRYLYEQNETSEIVVRAIGSRAARRAKRNKEGARKAAERAAELQIHRLILEVHGNPFRRVSFSSSWRTDTAIALAKQMYESRDFSAMPILADALQDAGCDDEGILSHCRTASEHIRGCWVVDLVLNKS